MIDTIEITIQCGVLEMFNAFIIYSDKSCYINNKIFKLSDEFLSEFLRTIRLWKNEYGYDKNIDSEEFRIVIKTNDKKEIFHGKGVFPNNYKHFKELLGDIHD